MLPYLLRGPGYTVSENYKVIQSPSGDLEPKYYAEGRASLLA